MIGQHYLTVQYVSSSLGSEYYNYSQSNLNYCYKNHWKTQNASQEIRSEHWRPG